MATNPALDPRDDLIRHYRWLRHYGINDSHSGNASVRVGSDVWITPTGACADTLTGQELVRCHPHQPPPEPASLDAPLHLAVYHASPKAAAVLHSHGPYTVAMTLGGDDYLPPDFEGQLYFPRVPVLSIAYSDYVAQAPRRVAKVLADYPIAVVRGHGVYACAETLALAYKWTCSLEHSAKTCFIARQAGALLAGSAAPT